MRDEIIIRKEDGSRVKIKADLSVSFNDVYWNLAVAKCEKRKRTFINVIDRNCYFFRKMSRSEKREFIDKEHLNHVSISDIEDLKDRILQKVRSS